MQTCWVVVRFQGFPFEGAPGSPACSTEIVYGFSQFQPQKQKRGIENTMKQTNLKLKLTITCSVNK